VSSAAKRVVGWIDIYSRKCGTCQAEPWEPCWSRGIATHRAHSERHEDAMLLATGVTPELLEEHAPMFGVDLVQLSLSRSVRGPSPSPTLMGFAAEG
jgi:hypothetical protein